MMTDVLPAPFAWMPISAGKVTLITEKGWAKNYIPQGQPQTFDVPVFTLAKYPLTNAQFSRFIDAHGYENRGYWTHDGWQTKLKESWSEPLFWRNPKFNGAHQPVVGVSFYEATAFCAWLSSLTQEKIVLPTEQQWQRAAQGDDERSYAWGKDWDANKCNNSVGKDWEQSSTSLVMKYEGVGNSAFDVADMTGNVWEWTSTVHESGDSDVNGDFVRVLRGGSWNDDLKDYFRVSFRVKSTPDNRQNFMGFRLARV
jgi:formylglycine-generating enzyme required for sulfatase activity